MQFPPHDSHPIFQASHAYTPEGITYDILVFQHQLNFIISLSLTLPTMKFTLTSPTMKFTRNMHSVLNAR